MRLLPPFFALLLCAAAADAVRYQDAAAPAIPAAPAAAGQGYADLVRLVESAPVVVDVEIRRARRLSPAQSPGVRPGATRFLVEANVRALVRGADGLPGRISYVVDLPNDARGRPAKLAAKSRQLILAQPAGGRIDQLRLVAPDAQFAWDPALDARIRGIIAALIAPDAPPRITGIGSAFHVPGAIPGESETQIFLRTADSRPISLTILRRPGEQPRWAVALGEMTDDSAAPPARETLLWYRLACGLPRTLPDSAVAELDAGAAAAVRADYRLVLDGLGPCGATPPVAA